MQTTLSLAHSVYRIVFRGGSPQRIQYSDRRLIAAILGLVVLLIAAQMAFFQATIIEIGLLLFTLLSGTYIGAALLTRRVARVKLRPTLLAVFLIFGAAQLPLLLAAPFVREAGTLRTTLASLTVLAAVVGLGNCLQFALNCSKSRAWASALVFACVLGAFYTTMVSLLFTVFSA